MFKRNKKRMSSSAIKINANYIRNSLQFNGICFYYFFMLLTLIALCFVIINLCFTEEFYGLDVAFLLISFCYIFLMKLNNCKILLPLSITIITVLIALYDGDLFDLVLYSDELSNNAKMIKERMMVMLQMCLLFSDNFHVNFINFVINTTVIIACKFKDMRNIDGKLEIKEIIYFLCYMLFYMFLLIKIKKWSNNDEFIFKTLETSKEYSNFFKKYIKNYSKTPIFILTLIKKKEIDLKSMKFNSKKNGFLCQSRNILKKISIMDDIKYIKDQDYILNLSFINKQAQEMFYLERVEDIENLLKDIIVFTEKQERTNGSNHPKEKIGDLREECFKIINRLKSFPMFNACNIVLDSEYKLKNNNENSHFLIHCFPFQHQDKINILLCFNDISDQFEIDRLKALDAYKDSIMANVTHDLRTPLQSMLACVDVFEEKNLTEQESMMLDIARSDVLMMGSLIQDILDENQIKMGKIKLNFKEFKTKEFSQEIVNFMKIIAKEHSVLINSKFAEGIPSMLYSDQIRLKQVLINLMNNALKFTPKNGTITLEVSVSPKKPKYVCFGVKDTGNGIPQEIIDKLFKPYASFEGKNGINKQGLILYIDKCI